MGRVEIHTLGKDYRVVDHGGPGEFYFERRSEDATGAEIWIPATTERRETVTMPRELAGLLYLRWRAAENAPEPQPAYQAVNGGERRRAQPLHIARHTSHGTLVDGKA